MEITLQQNYSTAKQLQLLTAVFFVIDNIGKWD